MAKKIRNFAAILAVSAVVGTILLVLVFLLPVGPMRKNVEKSVGDMLKTGDEIPEDAFSQYLWKNRETYTDAIMVQNAIERLPDKNAYEHAMWMYHYDLEEDVWTPEDSLKSFCESHENVNNMYLHIYARYWHGYLLYLKPLLLLFSWQHVVWLELAVQIALMIWVLVTAIQKQIAGVAVVTLGSFLFMKPVLVLVSLTMSVCWILTLLAVEYMLLHHDRLHEKGQYPEFFLIVGILTSYFDFLTYPIVTLGIPLCCYFLLERDRLWNNIKRLTGFSVSWAIGYAGMWAAKWVIADLTLHTGTIKDAIWSIIGHQIGRNQLIRVFRRNSARQLPEHLHRIGDQQFDVAFDAGQLWIDALGLPAGAGADQADILRDADAQARQLVKGDGAEALTGCDDRVPHPSLLP